MIKYFLASSLLIFLILVCYFRVKYIDANEVVGEYEIESTGMTSFYAEVPEADVLRLNSDYNFESQFFGSGFYSIKDAEITLSYTYSMGKASFTAPVQKDLCGNITIKLTPDHKYIRRKIQNHS